MTSKNKKQLGIYIHIPFCKRKCNYCDFISIPADTQVIKDYISTIIKEIKNNKNKYDEYKINTIFIGGGTPSFIEASYIAKIIEVIHETFDTDHNMEITIEANPCTITKEKLAAYKVAGINRLSIGLQSTKNSELYTLGRIHTYEDFEKGFLLSREMGFNNINIDIMFAIPKQTLISLTDTLEKVIKHDPEHISAYSLIIEEGTLFFEHYKNNKLNLPDEDEDREMYNAVNQAFANNGYNRYEISNYSKEGYECRHNISYWDRTDYVGFGVGAASLINNIRFRNTNEIKKYTIDMEDNIIINNKSILSKNEQMEEFMFLGLRMIKGINKNIFKKIYNQNIEDIYGLKIKKLKEEYLIEEDNERLWLTNKGIDLSNYALAEFLLTN